MPRPPNSQEVRQRAAAKLARILWKKGIAEIAIDEAVGFVTTSWKWYIMREDATFFKRYARKRGPKALHGTRSEITEEEEAWLRGAYGKRLHDWAYIRKRLNLSQWNLIRILREMGIYRAMGRRDK